MNSHTCHAYGCDAHVPPRMHMCRKHWFMVPKDLQGRLWDHYTPGQERRKNPSPEYLLTAAACVRAVAELEGHNEDDIARECGLYEAWAEMSGAN